MTETAPSDLDPHSEKQRIFREALGSFATGVTIATTRDTDGVPIGVTANSFNSVSLDPPLVLWSLAKSSLSYDAFTQSKHFAVHVLGVQQVDLSNRFARSQTDKWDGLKWHEGRLGSPIIDDYLTLFECKAHAQYDGGDHVILLGEVAHFEARKKKPLLFHAGRYSGISPLSKAT